MKQISLKIMNEIYPQIYRCIVFNGKVSGLNYMYIDDSITVNDLQTIFIFLGKDLHSSDTIIGQDASLNDWKTLFISIITYLEYKKLQFDKLPLMSISILIYIHNYFKNKGYNLLINEKEDSIIQIITKNDSEDISKLKSFILAEDHISSVTYNLNNYLSLIDKIKNCNNINSCTVLYEKYVQS